MLENSTPDRRLLCLAALLVTAISLGFAGNVLAQEKSATATADQQLINQLGDDEYQVREAAEDRILQRGADILPLLNEARRSPDPEVRLRAMALYKQLSARVRKDNFSRFADMAKDVDLPGWKRFQE